MQTWDDLQSSTSLVAKLNIILENNFKWVNQKKTIILFVNIEIFTETQNVKMDNKLNAF